MIAGVVHKTLAAAGVPVESVSVGRRDDKSTWRVDLAPDATKQQKAAAFAAIAAFDVAAELAKPPPATTEQRLADAERRLAALEVR